MVGASIGFARRLVNALGAKEALPVARALTTFHSNSGAWGL
jgi:hypothetical protein